jgi:WS/DGAT C-terminal domain
VDLQVAEFGDSLELRNRSAEIVTVYGYSDEEYLHIGPNAVWRNANSPATYINLRIDRNLALPAHADPAAEPDWQRVSTQPGYSWHDHRTHWMSPSLPPPPTATTGVRLPVGEPDPAARMQAVKSAMDRGKATGEGVVVSGALAVMGQTPVQVEQRWLDLFAGRATAVVTNIAGPPEPVALAGVPLRGFTAWVPSTGPIGIGLSICSYAGDLPVGIAVDEVLVPDSDQLLTALADEVATLGKLQ